MHPAFCGYAVVQTLLTLPLYETMLLSEHFSLPAGGGRFCRLQLVESARDWRTEHSAITLSPFPPHPCVRWRLWRRGTGWSPRASPTTTAVASGTSISRNTGGCSRQEPDPLRTVRATERLCLPRERRCSWGTSTIKVRWWGQICGCGN